MVAIRLLAFAVLACLFLQLCSCAEYYEDIQRPQYHFMPEKWWQNDPNGPMYFNGYYHLFYQYTPDRASGDGLKYWGHAVSKDLIFWERLPVAISPTPGTYDAGGIWSGSATIVNGEPIILYTAIGWGESQAIAKPANLSDPKLIEWTKPKYNPLILDPSTNMSLDGFRDPTTMWPSSDGKTWNLLVGAGVGGKLGKTLLYQTTDFVKFTFVHPFFQETPPLVGDMFECPDFYELDGAYVLKVSTMWRDVWTVGKYDEVNNVFVPSLIEGLYDYGDFYASKSFYDTVQKRRIVFGWITEAESQDSNNKLGWSGVQTLPRETILDQNGFLAQNPVAEIEKLRTRLYSFPGITLDNSVKSLNVSQGMQLEIAVKVKSADAASRFGLNVRSTPDRKESTQIVYNPAQGPFVNMDLPGADYRGLILAKSDPNLCLDLCNQDGQCFSWAYSPIGDQNPTSPMCFLKRGYPALTHKNGTVCGVKASLNVIRSNSSLAADADHSTQTGPLSAPLTDLRLYIDHSVIEIYANGGKTNIVARVYPTRADSQLVSVFASGGTISADIQIWDLKSIW